MREFAGNGGIVLGFNHGFLERKEFNHPQYGSFAWFANHPVLAGAIAGNEKWNAP